MSDHVLITGGAGFIGSHVADELLRHGHRVRVLDDLTPQVHGTGHHRPRYLAPEEALVPLPTPETKPPSLESVYAPSKYDQERLCLLAGRAYGIPTVALRFFNDYGPRQALSNPYTGVLAIFAARRLTR